MKKILNIIFALCISFPAFAADTMDTTTFKGKVSTPDKYQSGAPGIQVTAIDADSNPITGYSTTTDEKGYFTLQNLPSNATGVRLEKDLYATTDITDFADTCKRTGNTCEKDSFLQIKHQDLSGSIQFENGQTISNGSVTATGSDNSFAGTTINNGTYTIAKANLKNKNKLQVEINNQIVKTVQFDFNPNMTSLPTIVIPTIDKTSQPGSNTESANADQTITISGTVTDEQQKPAESANIVALNAQKTAIQQGVSTLGTSTDASGHFTLALTSDAKYLQISYVGYTKQTIPIDVSNTTNYNIQLSPDETTLNTGVTISATYDCTDEELQKQDPKAKTGKLKTENNITYCYIDTCIDNFIPNDDHTKCVASTRKCTTDELQKIPHATEGEVTGDGTCYATKCEYGYNPQDGACVGTSGDCNPMPQNATKAHSEYNATTDSHTCIVDECEEGFTRTPDKLACAKKTLSKEDAEKQIAELQQNADAMKEKEQSTENKLLGAASMGAMGIGGMQALSALSEQSADAAAEQDMTAYLATFRCDYGQGQNIHGGDTDIILPGGNELISLYTEYIQLASDLKTRKESLGMSPGIESEMLLDKADTGLYDDVGTGITTGTFASLARALSDPNSADAALWAQQQADTASKLKTGLITAGAGAVIGVAGNIAINKNAPKENSEQILASYESLKKLEYEISQLPDQTAGATCPAGTTGTVPNCNSTNTEIEYNANTNKTEVASDKYDTKTQNNRIDTTELEKITTFTSVDSIISTLANTDAENKNDENIVYLSTRNLFKLNEYTLVSTSKTIIATFANQILSTNKDNPTYCLIVTGNTDKTGNDRINQPLSEKRAQAVTSQLRLFGIPEANILSKGAGSQNCTTDFRNKKGCKNNKNCEACRNVTIEYKPSPCTSWTS